MAILAFAACGGKEKPGGKAGVPEVEVTNPVASEVFEYETLPGRIVAIDDVEIKARVTGLLEKVDFVEGSEVKVGDPLFQIDPREYKARVESAKAGLERAQASLEQAESDFNRSNRLKESDAVSLEEVEMRRTQMLDAKGSLRSAQADLDNAELDLEYTRILSPIDGKISSTAVTQGNLIAIGDTLTRVVRQAPVYVSFEMPERAVLRWDGLIRNDGETGFSESVNAEIGLLSEEGFPHCAKVDFVDNAVNTSTGTLRLRAVLENESRTARVGLYTRVRISLKKPIKTLLVPERAVGTDQGQRFVFLVGEDEKIIYRTVVPGQMHDGMLAITEGLEATDRVVTEGLLALRAGMEVKPVATPAP